MTTAWQDATRAELAHLRIEEGWSYPQIARAYGVAAETARKQILRWGIAAPPPRETWSALSDEDLIRLYLRHRLSYEEIGARYEVSGRTVGRRLHGLGIAGGRRGRIEWAKVDAQMLRRLYWDNGLRPTQIGVLYGVDRDTVLRRMGHLGVERRPPGRGSHVRVPRLAAWYAVPDEFLAGLYLDHGLSAYAIGRRYGVSDRAVRDRLHAIGVPMRLPWSHVQRGAR